MTTDYFEMARKIVDYLLQHDPINPYIAEVEIENALRKVRQETLEESAKVAEDRRSFGMYPPFRRQDEIAKAIRDLGLKPS